MNCKRCGRELKGAESIKRGYGRKCWHIIQLQDSVKNDVVNEKYETEINFLKMEISMLKRQFQLLKSNGVKNTESIERIQQEKQRPEQSVSQVNMVVVIKELKVVFETGRPLEKDFRFSENDVGIKTPEQIAEILKRRN